ncbi:hypothetical protein Xaut_2118 [Xanthobacter versatilis]|uniref:Uncharacterized protein n=1 Tax=Xanthobacter autotrophicus (strain ATCC BAA-1158 / Py2) TaxID=78245 RepID=A7IH69_XANP2|nr:hypothetical protein Xaut_2118 [Xanthobacter autotrophicus Py2]
MYLPGGRGWVTRNAVWRTCAVGRVQSVAHSALSDPMTFTSWSSNSSVKSMVTAGSLSPSTSLALGTDWSNAHWANAGAQAPTTRPASSAVMAGAGLIVLQTPEGGAPAHAKRMA